MGISLSLEILEYDDEPDITERGEWRPDYESVLSLLRRGLSRFADGVTLPELRRALLEPRMTSS